MTGKIRNTDIGVNWYPLFPRIKSFKKSIAPLLINSRGFTLIEMIMVIVFLSVALLATMNMMSTSVSGSMNIELINTATDLANEKMEEIFADKKSKGYGYVQQNNYQSESNPNGFSGFTRLVEISSQSNSKRIRVRVTHPDLQDIVLEAYITNY